MKLKEMHVYSLLADKYSHLFRHNLYIRTQIQKKQMPTMENLLLTTAYFPPISYFYALFHSSRAYIEQYENFGKQSYRNRCLIMTANGVIPLTVPVVKANSKTLVRDLRIVYTTPWQKLHFRGIESAYKNSPYYEYYIDDLMPFFEKRETFLLDLNQALLGVLLDLLQFPADIRLTADYIPEGSPDYRDLRNAIHPKPARRLPGADFPLPVYRQTFGDRIPFTPDLSILDLLFCCGPDARQKLLV